MRPFSFDTAALDIEKVDVNDQPAKVRPRLVHPSLLLTRRTNSTT